MLAIILVVLVSNILLIIIQKGEKMKHGKWFWFVWFIASFAAFHYGLEACGFSFFTLDFVATKPMFVRIVKLFFGAMGLVSLVTLLKACKDCRECKA